MAPQPGLMGGTAIAEVLFGTTNPSGKLSFTYPRHPNDLLTHDALMADVLPENNDPENLQYRPQYTFGHGLGYAGFSYSAIRLSKTVLKGQSDSLAVEVDIRNTGTRNGKEAVDLFVSDRFAIVAPSFRKHRKFTKLELKPGETKTLRFLLTASDFDMVNYQNQTVTEPGEFIIRIGKETAPVYYEEK